MEIKSEGAAALSYDKAEEDNIFGAPLRRCLSQSPIIPRKSFGPDSTKDFACSLICCRAKDVSVVRAWEVIHYGQPVWGRRQWNRSHVHVRKAQRK